MTGNIPLRGTAGIVCSLAVTPDPGAQTLAIIGSGTNLNVTVGTVAETCNDQLGYSVRVTSANCTATPANGAALTSLGTSTIFPYTVNSSTAPNGYTVTGVLAPADCPAGRNIFAPTTGQVPQTSTVSIVYNQIVSPPNGTYTDTLTFTMTTN